MAYKLQFELVPDGCWYQNLRTALPKAIWDTVRRQAYARASGRCMICGRETSRLDAHEQWSYDEENRVQKLERVIAVCRNCHEVIHIGRTQLMGRGDEAMEWFMRVNGCSQMEFHEALGESNATHRRRNQMDGWVTDIAWLYHNVER